MFLLSRYRTYLPALLLLLLALPGLYAQGPPGGPRRGGPPPDMGRPGDRPHRDGPPPGGMRGRRGDGPGREGPPDGAGMFNILSAEMRFGDKPVTGAPYSAQVAIESAQALPDGTRITRKLNVSLYRDTEGRVRREQPIVFFGVPVTGAATPQLIFITDPRAGVHYVLDPERLTARQMILRQDRPPPPPPNPPADLTVAEALGKKTIEGVEAEGTRSTTTIPIGHIGNDRPIKIVSERWYAPQLQIVVLSSHNDPRLGELTYRLTNIRREEPARTLFEVPANYKIEQVRERGGPPRGDREKGRPPMPFKKPGEF